MNNLLTAGAPVAQGTKVLIMVHGRGASAHDILGISQYLTAEGFSLVAPQAPGNTWYPLSFLAPPQDNEPYLSQSLGLLAETVSHLEAQGVTRGDMYFLGFSQGACLVSEYTTRNATKYGGIVVFTGGLIGDSIYTENYSGNFNGTPIFIGTGNPDHHVPVERVHETAGILEKMGAKVTVKVYDNRPHTISQDEVNLANQLIFNS